MSGSQLLLLFLTASVIFLLMGLALVAFVIRYQRRMLQQSEAFQAKESKHKEVLLKASIDSQEKERSRIASDLHDGLGAHLSSIRLLVLMHGQENPESYTFSEEIAEKLLEGIHQVREISHDLIPGTLHAHGLMPALRELVREINKGNALEVTFTAEATFPQLPADHELAIYRIVQELISNTLRHAEATKTELSMRMADQWIIEYKDNGKGFDPEQVKPGLGLYNIQSRARSFGGAVDFRQLPGSGMHAVVTFPAVRSSNPASTEQQS